jgi:hypothetical protein
MEPLRWFRLHLDHLTIEQSGPSKTMVSEHGADPDGWRDFERRRERERALHRRGTIKAIGDEVLAYLNGVVDRLESNVHPTELHRRLANAVQTRVHCRGFHRAEAEKAAGYVFFPATEEPALPIQVLLDVLDQLDAADRKGQVSQYVEGKGGGRGQWFNGILKIRLRELGITQRKKGRRRR